MVESNHLTEDHRIFVSIGEAKAALLATKLAVSLDARQLISEGDSITIITISAINRPKIISDWRIEQIIRDVIFNLDRCSS
jgi:hypothetical protein